MVQKIVWSDKAINTYESIIEYLLENFTEREAEQFTELILDKLALIKVFPTMFRRTKVLPNTFRTVIHRRVILVYRYKPWKSLMGCLPASNKRKERNTPSFLRRVSTAAQMPTYFFAIVGPI
jgi:plasmid stabilization system protein ParE